MKKLIYIVILTVICGLVKSEWTSPYEKWSNGPSKDPNHFTIAVWLQDPSYSFQWQRAGVNMYIGLWKGPTVKQLEQLKATNMQTIAT